MIINQLLFLIDDANLPESETKITFLGEGKCVITCDKVEDKFYNWVSHASYITASCDKVRDRVAHNVVLEVEVDEPLVWSCVK